MWHLDPSSDLVATDMDRKLSGAVPFGGGRAASPSNIMWPGTRPTCMPSFILIYPTVWPRSTNVTDRTDRQDRQRSDSIGRTVLQTVARKRNAVENVTLLAKIWELFDLPVCWVTFHRVARQRRHFGGCTILGVRNTLVNYGRPYSNGQAIIFYSCGFFFSLSSYFFLFSSPILSGLRFDVYQYHTSTHT